MRIDAADTKILVNMKNIFGSSQDKHDEKMFLSNANNWVIRDNVEISGDGMKKLYEYAEEIAKSKWGDNELKFHQNYYLSALGETLEKTGRQTEQMKSLALLAQDSQLSEEDRLELQKKMTQLQHDLFIAIHNMSYKMAEEKFTHKPQISPKDEIKSDYDLTMKVLTNQEKKIKGEYIAIIKNDDNTTVKADFYIKDNGDGTFSYTDESWDYASFKANKEAKKFRQVYEKEKNEYVDVFSYNADDKGNLVYTGSLEDIQSYLKSMEDKTFDYEAWENEATLSLKDSETSMYSAQNLSRRIDDLRKKNDEFIAFFKSQEGQSAIAEDIKKPEPLYENAVTEGDGGGEPDKGKFQKLKGFVMLSDVRIKHPVGIIEELYVNWDSFLKDNTYKSLGFAGYWDKYLGREVYRDMQI